VEEERGQGEWEGRRAGSTWREEEGGRGAMMEREKRGGNTEGLTVRRRHIHDHHHIHRRTINPFINIIIIRYDVLLVIIVYYLSLQYIILAFKYINENLLGKIKRD